MCKFTSQTIFRHLWAYVWHCRNHNVLSFHPHTFLIPPSYSYPSPLIFYPLPLSLIPYYVSPTLYSYPSSSIPYPIWNYLPSSLIRYQSSHTPSTSHPLPSSPTLTHQPHPTHHPPYPILTPTPTLHPSPLPSSPLLHPDPYPTSLTPSSLTPFLILPLIPHPYPSTPDVSTILPTIYMCVCFVTDPRVGSAFHELLHQILHTCNLPVVVIATSSVIKEMNSDLQEGFLHHIQVQVGLTT